MRQRRIEALNNTVSRYQIDLGLCIAFLVTHLLFLLLSQTALSIVLQLTEVILLLVLSFRVKSILDAIPLKQDKARPAVLSSYQRGLSGKQDFLRGVYTVIFNLFHLQYRINKLSAKADSSLADWWFRGGTNLTKESATLPKSLEGQAQAIRETAIDEIRVDSDLQPDIGGEPKSKAETADLAP